MKLYKNILCLKNGHSWKIEESDEATKKFLNVLKPYFVNYCKVCGKNKAEMK